MDGKTTLTLVVSHTFVIGLYPPKCVTDSDYHRERGLPVHRLWIAEFRPDVQPIHECGVGIRTWTPVFDNTWRHGFRLTVRRISEPGHGRRHGRVWDGRTGRLRRRGHAVWTLCVLCLSRFVVRSIHKTWTLWSLSWLYGCFRLRLTHGLRCVQRLRQLPRKGCSDWWVRRLRPLRTSRDAVDGDLTCSTTSLAAESLRRRRSRPNE